MTIYFSKSTVGFYDDAIHDAMPGDAVKITAEKHAYLLDGQSNGKRIVSDNKGAPVLADPEPMTAEELSISYRERRNALLCSSDWTMVADAPVDQAAWRTYRQVLRDVPAQPGFPVDVAWPDPPSQ